MPFPLRQMRQVRKRQDLNNIFVPCGIFRALARCHLPLYRWDPGPLATVGSGRKRLRKRLRKRRRHRTWTLRAVAQEGSPVDVNEEDVRWERKLVPKAEGKRRGVQPRT